MIQYTAKNCDSDWGREQRVVRTETVVVGVATIKFPSDKVMCVYNRSRTPEN